VACPECGRSRRHKDSRTIVVRSLFGTLRLASPRWWHCGCQPQASRTFSPLAAVLPTRVTPELQYLEARFAGLVSYGLSAQLLGEVFPLGRPLHATAVRHHVQAVAQRLEDELGAEQFSFIEGCPRDWEQLPRPDLPLVVGLDGGYVHSSTQRSRRDGWFEVIAGKVMPADGLAKCFGYVQTYDTKPKRRLFEVLTSQGMQANQQVTFLTDGGEDIRDLPCYLNPQAWGTSRGSNDPARSRGTSSPTSPTSVASVLGLVPLREFGTPRPAGSPFSYPQCSVNSVARPRSKTALTISGKNPPAPVNDNPSRSTRAIRSSNHAITPSCSTNSVTTAIPDTPVSDRSGAPTRPWPATASARVICPPDTKGNISF
jgi:hypothetical protein